MAHGDRVLRAATWTESTATADTMIVAVPFLAPLVPVIVAVPAPAARICALVVVVLEMLAMPVLLDPNVTVAPLTGLPFTSVTVAVISCVCPTCNCATFGDSTTELTGAALTVATTLSVIPSLLATITEVPALTPVTSPAIESTVATAGVRDFHRTTRPGQHIARRVERRGGELRGLGDDDRGTRGSDGDGADRNLGDDDRGGRALPACRWP